MTGETLTPVPGAEPRYDDDGREIVEVLTCGTCGRSWNDAAVSSRTPAPSGRCPFEDDHEEEDDDDETMEYQLADAKGRPEVTRSFDGPAWERFGAMASEVHDMLVGAAQCRNHLRSALAVWDECGDGERRRMVADALERLTRVGI